MKNMIGFALCLLAALAILAGMEGAYAQSDEGLVAEWHFDEGSGSIVKDSSGNVNDGTIYGATWVDGKFGKALSFDGVDDYVDAGNAARLDAGGTNTLTISAWVRRTTPKSPILVVIRRSIDNSGYVFGVGILGTSTPNQIKMTKYGVIDIYLGKFPEDTNWHYLAGVWNNRGAFVYIDGVLNDESTDTSNFRPSPSGNALIGGDTGDQGYGNGIIDEVRIYNRALGAEEIKALYEGSQTALSLTKTASPTSIKQGQTTTITLSVKNTGTTEIKDIEIADTVPQDLIKVSGETSKTYASLSPKDSREFQYILQINEAGTFNLNPATAAYADEKGNYRTIKSKPASIEVISSLITTLGKVQTTSDIPTASVHLHGEKTDVVLGEDILLKLAAVNLIGNPVMHVQVIITPPSGMSVTSSEFVQSGAGIYTTTYELEPGKGRDIEIRIKSNQVGDFDVKGRIIYYFGDEPATREDHMLNLPIKVRKEIASTPAQNPTAAPAQKSTPGFELIIGISGLLLAVILKRSC